MQYLCLLVYIGMVGVHKLSHERSMATTGSKVHSIVTIL